jgi:hypothetical protein
VAVSEVGGAAWVLQTALLVVSRVVVAKVAVVVNDGVTAERWDLGCERRGWGSSRGQKGGSEGLLDLRLKSWGEQFCSVA